MCFFVEVFNESAHNRAIFNQNGTQEIMAKQIPSVTEWRIIGVSGATADGREISAAELREMAETYDPEVYTAQINLEHFRFLFDDWKSGYGDVRELKVEPWAKDPSKTALLARFSVLPALQNIWDNGKKMFCSMEIQSNFAKSGKAYLVGVAITDSPASLGTTQNYSMVQSKLSDDMKLSEYGEWAMPEQFDYQDEEKPLTENVFTHLMKKYFGKTDNSEKQPEQSDVKQEDYAQQIQQLQQANEDQAQLLDRLLAEYNELKTSFNQFKQQVETQVYTGERKEHSGGNPVLEAGW